MKNSEVQTGNPAVEIYDDEIDIGDLFRTLWSGKWFVLATTAVCGIVAITIALMTPNQYRAEALLAPNQDEASGGLSAMAAQYSGLASLAGIEIANRPADKSALTIEVLQSRKFISDFVERHDILVPLMAAKGWNAETRELRIDPETYDEASSTWVRETNSPRQSKPSMQEAFVEFESRLTISEDARTGFVVLAIEHYSPDVAKQWVDWLVEDVNSTMMEADVAQAEQAIGYLNEQIASTSVADLQNVFYRLIEDQTKTIMLAKVSPEYIFMTVDPALAPEIKSRPNRALIAILGLVLGLTAGVVIVLVRSGLAPGKD